MLQAMTEAARRHTAPNPAIACILRLNIYGEAIMLYSAASRIENIIRRKGDSSIESSVAAFNCFRKKMKKDTKKLIASLKQMDSKLEASSLLDQDQHLSAVIRVIREVNVINCSIFQSLLVFLSTSSKPKQSRWSLVSKLMHKGVIACEEKQENVNEIETVDAALSQVSDSEKVKIAQKRLETLEMSIDDLENCLERLSRPLIKSRATLLNIISQ
ncbi:hypothetical protein D5086_010498 [Populus alba]|uniref:Uncharacterized protein n=1 Tax=Populus alba TaxID=43335 RepID=A0ACC4CB18_POPAL